MGKSTGMRGIYFFLFMACVSNLTAKSIDTVGKAALGGLALSGIIYAVAEVQLSRMRKPAVRVTAQSDVVPDQCRNFWLKIQKVCQGCLLGSASMCGAVLAKKWWDGRMVSEKSHLKPTPLTMESWKKQFFYSCKEWPGMTPSEAACYGQLSCEEQWQQVLTYAKDGAAIGKIVDALTYDSYQSSRIIDTQRLRKSLPWLHPDRALTKYEKKIGRELTGKEQKMFKKGVASLAVVREAVQVARDRSSSINPVLGVEEATLEALYHMMYGTKEEKGQGV